VLIMLRRSFRSDVKYSTVKHGQSTSPWLSLGLLLLALLSSDSLYSTSVSDHHAVRYNDQINALKTRQAPGYTKGVVVVTY